LEESDRSECFDKVFYEKPSEVLDTLNLGRTLFELREYQKCAHLLHPIREQSQSALFLRNYATYLMCE
jgi:hypothetical protein